MAVGDVVIGGASLIQVSFLTGGIYADVVDTPLVICTGNATVSGDLTCSTLRAATSIVAGDTGVASVSAVFTANSIGTNYQGIVVPRLTTAQVNSITAPNEGMIVFNTSTNVFLGYDGAAWNAL